MVAVKGRWSCFLLATIYLLSISGCATTPKAPYIADTKVLPPEEFTSQIPPEVLVRYANQEEIKNISEFPDSKEKLSTKIGKTTAIVLLTPIAILSLPLMIAFVGTNLAVEAIFPSDPDLEKEASEKAFKEALEKFPGRLTNGIQQRFLFYTTGESQDLLEVVYFVDGVVVSCFGIHAKITLKSNDLVIYQEIIRIDHRAFSADIQQPECTISPEKIHKYADEVIPRMIRNRLPGLPWKSDS